MNVRTNQSSSDDAGDERAPPADSRPLLRPPQFRLSTLLAFTTVAGLLFAAMAAAGPIGAFVLLLLALSIVAHVTSTAIGTRLREIGSMPDADEPGPTRRAKRDVRHDEYAPVTGLGRRVSLGRSLIAPTVAGAMLFGTCGGALLIWIAWSSMNFPTALVAVGSSSVLGGLLGFAAGSFTQVASGAWWEAHR